MKRIIALAVLTAIAVTGLAWLGGTASATEEGKVLVCKYVGTPGEDERLKDGKNPIEVDASSTGGSTEPGSIFADAQGRSLVIGEGDICPATPDARAKYRVVVRMAGLGAPYRDSIKWFPGSPTSVDVLDLVCGAKVSAGFQANIGSQEIDTPTFTSKAGPVLRLFEDGVLLHKVRASDGC